MGIVEIVGVCRFIVSGRMLPPELPASARATDTDYQWFDVGPHSIRTPESIAATGWVAVRRGEMPTVMSDGAEFVQHHNLRLYQRPLVITTRVRDGEETVARDAVRDAATGRFARRVSTPLTTPLGPMPDGRTLGRLWVFARVWLRDRRGKVPSEALVARFLGTDAVGIKRYSEENRMMPSTYVRLVNAAILEGRGRWVGQITHGARNA